MMCLNSFCMKRSVWPYPLKSKTLRTFRYTSQSSGFKAWCGKMSGHSFSSSDFLHTPGLFYLRTALTPEAHDLGPYSDLSVIKQHQKNMRMKLCTAAQKKQPDWPLETAVRCSLLDHIEHSSHLEKQIPLHYVPQSPQSSTGWAWWVMFSIVNRCNQNISSLWSGKATRYGGDLFEHGAVNICGSEEESEECCNRPVLASEV